MTHAITANKRNQRPIRGLAKSEADRRRPLGLQERGGFADFLSAVSAMWGFYHTHECRDYLFPPPEDEFVEPTSQ